MNRRISQLIIGMTLAAMAVSAEAQVVGRGFGGALGGAALGSLVGGKKGAKTGAIIGGSVGVLRGVSERSRAQAEQEAYARQAAERQQLAQDQQQAELEQMKAQQAAQAASANAGRDATVIEIQKSLIRLGFDPGDVDGNLSPKTVAAIKQYQSKNKLLEDGTPSQALLTHMLKNGG